MLKRVLLLTGLLLLNTFLGFSQAAEIKALDIVGFDSKNVGVVNKNSEKIIYTFYMSDLAKEKGVKEGVLHFFDSNLKDLNKVSLSFSKSDLKIRVKDNGKNVMLYYYDSKARKNIYKIYTPSGDLVYTKEVPFERKGMWMFNLEANNEDVPVYPIPNNGFLIYHYSKKTKMGYNFYYINEEEKKEWTYSSPLNCPDYKDASIVCANDKVVVLFDREWKSLNDKKTKKNLIVINAESGQEFFSVQDNYQEKPGYYTKAMMTSNNELVVLSEYYEIANKFVEHKNFNNGYLFEKFDLSGKKLSEKKLDFNDQSFAEKINFQLDADNKINSNLFFHDCFEFEGKFYFVSEKVERMNVVNNRDRVLVQGVFIPFRMNSTTTYGFQDYYILGFDNDFTNYKIDKLTKNQQEKFEVSYVRRPLLNMFGIKFENDMSHLYSKFESQLKYSLVFCEKEVKQDEVVYQIRKIENKNGDVQSNSLQKDELSEGESYRYRILPLGEDKFLSVKSYGSLKLNVF